MPVPGDDQRLAPGSVLADRYRIVSLLGQGGMGYVYRADDLKLGQPVALKFLRESAGQDEPAVERMLGEVRTARQVAHPNVCRVYDIGEVDGQHFISMELIDGEDLASLLRRIGRLPQDKAVVIARQLCAGLAAAHSRGILHRDLKPANVMLDGEGQVRITDFGLAGFAAEADAAGVKSGTPSYMAPEQLTDGRTSPRSDIYALGLVLFEVFTGKRAIGATSYHELLELHRTGSLSTPSSVLNDIDPTVERVILHCLERDPGRRPSSALAVAAALPGGDPLAAALAAGETPSPELVAAAGGDSGLGIRAAVIAYALCLVGLVGVTLTGDHRLTHFVPLPKSPEVLAERAREILRRLDHEGNPVDRAHGFGRDGDRLRSIHAETTAPDRWLALAQRPAALQFWYRESPRPLAAASLMAGVGNVRPQEPAVDVAAMANVVLEPDGQLQRLLIVPNQVEPDRSVPVAGDPSSAVLFELAGLDPTRFEPTAPGWTPPVFADTRAAWVGSFASHPDTEIRIEAAAHRGRWVYFELLGPWRRAERQETAPAPAGARAGQWISLSLTAVLLLGGAGLARRNLRLGRGDRRGAYRLAAYSFVVMLTAWVISAHHVPDAATEWQLVFTAIGEVLLTVAMTWVFYMALEPTVRRRWPEQIVAWSRALSGRFHDPLVASHILIGLTAGVLASCLFPLYPRVLAWLGHAQGFPLDVTSGLAGIGTVLATGLQFHWSAVFNGLAFTVLLVILRLVLRRQWLANGAFWLIFTAMSTAVMATHPVLDAIVSGAIVASWLLVLTRVGLLAVTHALLAFFILSRSAPEFAPGTWYATNASLLPAALALLATWALMTSLAGRPLFQIDD